MQDSRVEDGKYCAWRHIEIERANTFRIKDRDEVNDTIMWKICTFLFSEDHKRKASVDDIRDRNIIIAMELKYSKEYKLLRYIGNVGNVDDILKTGRDVERVKDCFKVVITDREKFIEEYAPSVYEEGCVANRYLALYNKYLTELDIDDPKLSDTDSGKFYSFVGFADRNIRLGAHRFNLGDDKMYGPIVRYVNKLGNDEQIVKLLPIVKYGIHLVMTKEFYDLEYSCLKSNVHTTSANFRFSLSVEDQTKRMYGLSILGPKDPHTRFRLFYVKSRLEKELLILKILAMLHFDDRLTPTTYEDLTHKMSKFIRSNSNSDIVITVRLFYMDILRFLLPQDNSLVASFYDMLKSYGIRENYPRTEPKLDLSAVKAPYRSTEAMFYHYGMIITSLIEMKRWPFYHNDVDETIPQLCGVQLILDIMAKGHPSILKGKSELITKLEPKIEIDHNTRLPMYLELAKIYDNHPQKKAVLAYFNFSFKVKTKWTDETFYENLAEASAEQWEQISSVFSIIS